MILYCTHSLAPLLHVLDDRVVRVTCMATRRPSYYLEEEVGAQVPLPDIQVALMHTAKDTILRMAVGFVSPMPGPEPHHYYHLLGHPRRGGDRPPAGRRPRRAWPRRTAARAACMWLADAYLNGRVETSGTTPRTTRAPAGPA